MKVLATQMDLFALSDATVVTPSSNIRQAHSTIRAISSRGRVAPQPRSRKRPPSEPPDSSETAFPPTQEAGTAPTSNSDVLRPQSREGARITPSTEQLCIQLFPAGMRQGGSIVLRSFEGEPGQSLRISVTGKCLGKWRDCKLGGSEGNDLIELGSKARRISIEESMNQIEAWLEGIQRRSTESISPSGWRPTRLAN
jgi:hypothetical protein